ncbi:hypothetical protein HUS23_10855 [Ectothiorhodospiraceae bacterium 2226]|nr:hypothetical protein HUS23_10855 [Ectothiorhodospiraceae bacterium 2226]
MEQGSATPTGGTRARGRHPFAIRDCALIAIATGKRAQNLKELRDHLLTINPASIYYHFWGGLLETGFEEREFNNDFAIWARNALHDFPLSERLAVIDPSAYTGLESLRQELIDIIEERIDESEYLPWTRTDQQFEFIHSQIVVFNTRRTLECPEDLPAGVAQMSTSSIFYHFIDARRRSSEGLDDFRAWLCSYGEPYSELCDRLADIDPFFITLTNLRRQLSAVFGDYFGEAAS